MKNQTSNSLYDIFKRTWKGSSVEQLLLEAFPSLKILRGIPRLYQRSNPSLSYIKQEFSNFPILKKYLLEKLLLPSCKAPPDSKICLFTYMLSDGWGDLIAHKEMYHILTQHFLHISSIVCVPKGFSSPFENTISYERECPPELFPKEALLAIQNADLVLSIPTYYPHTEELKKISKARWLQIGQYGFLESSHFNPSTKNYSMGLHFLELGILTRAHQAKGDFRTLENQTLLYTLFGTATPQTVDIEIYRSSHSLFLAYLISPIGGAVYLHALLQSQQNNPKTIDICTPDLGWLIQYLQKHPILTHNFDIQELEIHFAGKIHRRQIASKGKKVRIICPGALSDHDFRTLVVLSEEFIAVRGDQSFSEVVSANRLFFYDGAPHARYFVKDLLALAENKLSHNHGALTLFRAIGQAFAYNLPEETTEWVEETHFQEKEPWENIAKKIALALQSPQTLAGFTQFNHMIIHEYSCNETICQLVARKLTNPTTQEATYAPEAVAKLALKRKI